MITCYELDFCYLEIHDTYMYAIMKEGIVVSKENNARLIEISRKHYKDSPFVYITHRINSYAVDPIIYIKTAQVENLAGFAVVSKDAIQKEQIKLEKSFFNKEFKHFETLNEALIWKDEILSSTLK